jgi:tetratricopeptide (TPR) repeat protein
MPRDGDDDSPIIKLVNLLLLDMIKKQRSMARVRVDGPTELWSEGAWAEEMTPPMKIRPAMIDRLKEMADIPDDAPLRFESKIRLIVGIDLARTYDLDVLYSRSDGGGVIVVAQHEVTPAWLPSNEDVMHKASVLLSHASDALAREDARARVREAVERVKGQGGRGWFLRSAASVCTGVGIYDDALEYLGETRKLHAKYPAALVDIDVQTGIVYVETNRAKEAEAIFMRALAIAESLPRPNFYEVFVLLQVAQLALDRADVAAAEATLARIDATIELLLGPKSVARLIARPAQVRVMRERGDVAGAETLAVSSMRASEDGGLVGEAENLRAELAEIALARGDANGAIEHLRTILQLPSRSPTRARIYATLSRAQRAVGHDVDAVTSLRAARALTEGSLASDHPVRVEVERELATLTATAPYR